METALTLLDRWLPTPDVLIIDSASVAVARERVRTVGAAAGLAHTLVETAALIASELAMNQLRHASGGRFAAWPIDRGGVPGVEMVAADRGAGLADPAQAMAGKAMSLPGESLGAGLAAVFRLSDEVDVDVRIGAGTCFRARKLAAPPPRKSEVGIFARPFPGESVCGDDASFVRFPGGAAFTVADGLGHGLPAREASLRAVACLDDGPPDAILQAAEAAVAGTRGVTMAAVRHDARVGEVTHAGVGDITTHLERGGAVATFAGQAGTVGMARLRKHLRVDRERAGAGDVLLLWTDGITSAAGGVRAGLRHPVVVAHEIVTAHARPNDDALVLVARLA